MPVIQWGQRYIGWELSELTGLKPRTLRNYFTQLKSSRLLHPEHAGRRRQLLAGPREHDVPAALHQRGGPHDRYRAR